MSVTHPQGFVAAGVAAGLKSPGKLDMAVVVNEGPEHVAAGVFTTNRVRAASVTWTEQAIADGRIDAVVLNSGGANACTGAQGFADVHQLAEHVAAQLTAAGRETAAGDVAVAQTGLIGVLLPMDIVTAGATAALEAASATGGDAAAEAIRTTDSVSKTAVAAREGWSVGGIAKGAGMLAPGMATMLSVITTDAVIGSATAKAALTEAVAATFNRVDSDGCMSTNDTVLLLANGASGVEPSAEVFAAALAEVSASLSRQLVADAEGSEHDIAVTVENATSEEAAEAVARAVTRSNLFKTAIFGRDPNWGRIVSAAGTVPADVAPYDPTLMDVFVNNIQVCRSLGVGEDRSLVDLSGREVQVRIDLHAGDASATIWTNDLTHDYVHENSAYST